MSTRTTWINQQFEDGTPCVCGDGCGWTGGIESVEGIHHIHERITPGSIVPAGECPKCGTLAYIDDAHAAEHLKWLAQGELHKLRKPDSA